MAPQGTAREYVESFVKEQDVQDYLARQQPKYDPHKAQQQASETSHHEAPNQGKQQEQQRHEPSQSIHRPTLNPMPAADEQQTNEQQQQRQQPQVVWTYRDAADQRKEIHNAAQDNCADLHAELWSCFKDGSWWDKAKMCEAQKQKFWACYNKQKVNVEWETAKKVTNLRLTEIPEGCQLQRPYQRT